MSDTNSWTIRWKTSGGMSRRSIVVFTVFSSIGGFELEVVRGGDGGEWVEVSG